MSALNTTFPCHFKCHLLWVPMQYQCRCLINGFDGSVIPFWDWFDSTAMNRPWYTVVEARKTEVINAIQSILVIFKNFCLGRVCAGFFVHQSCLTSALRVYSLCVDEIILRTFISLSRNLQSRSTAAATRHSCS